MRPGAMLCWPLTPDAITSTSPPALRKAAVSFSIDSLLSFATSAFLDDFFFFGFAGAFAGGFIAAAVAAFAGFFIVAFAGAFAFTGVFAGVFTGIVWHVYEVKDGL